jgi:hypothetical protein
MRWTSAGEVGLTALSPMTSTPLWRQRADRIDVLPQVT